MKHLKVFLFFSAVAFSMSGQALDSVSTPNPAPTATSKQPNVWAGKKIFLDSQGDPVVYDFRSGTRPTVFLLIHGLGDDMTKLEGLANLLLKDGFGVMRVDLQGHGLTLRAYMQGHKDLPTEMTYQKNVQAITDLINRMQIQDLVIVGHSYGGGIAYGLAASLADSPIIHIRSVHLLAPYVQRIDKFLSEYYQSPDFLLNQANKTIDGTKTGAKTIQNTNPVAAFFNVFAQNAKIVASGVNKVFKVDQTKDFLLDPFVEKFMQRSYREYFLKEMNAKEDQLSERAKQYLDLRVEAAIRTTKGIRGFDLLDPASAFPVVKAPLQVLAGSKDALVVPDQMQAFDQRLTTMGVAHTLSFIEGDQSTHLFPRLMPSETYSQVIQFYSQH